MARHTGVTKVARSCGGRLGRDARNLLTTGSKLLGDGVALRVGRLSGNAFSFDGVS